MKSLRNLSFALLAGTLAACSGPAKVPPAAYNDGLVVSPQLAQANPAVVVVLPIENQTGRADLPLDQLRRLFHTGLVDLLYSPLALEYVDRRVIDATYEAGDLSEEAILRIFITGWDDSNWRTRSRLVIDADIYLVDTRNPEIGQALWGGHVQRVMEMAAARDVTGTERALMDRTLKQFVDETLSLPPRDPTRTSAVAR